MNFHPTRYYAGLSKTKKTKRLREIRKFGALAPNDPQAYVGFKTDIGVKTKTSSYVKTLKKRFASIGVRGTQTLRQKAKHSGVPYKFLKECYDRGLAAWRTGHRPGATEHQWGYHRIIQKPILDSKRILESKPKHLIWTRRRHLTFEKI